MDYKKINDIGNVSAEPIQDMTEIKICVKDLQLVIYEFIIRHLC